MDKYLSSTHDAYSNSPVKEYYFSLPLPSNPPQIDSRVLCVNEWSKPAGRQVFSLLARLYRALVWEGFILLAVAAREEPSHAADSTPGIKVEEPASENVRESGSGTENRGGSQTQNPEVAMETSSEAVQGNVGDGDGMETSEPDTRTPQDRSGTPEPASKLPNVKPASALVLSLRQLPPLFTVTSNVGRSLAELLSFLVKISTDPIHRAQRRGAGFVVSHYQPPWEEAISVCSEVTDLLLDSLNWEVPLPEACTPAMKSPIRDWLFGG